MTDPRESVRALSAALRELHRVLVRIEQKSYQDARGSFAKPAGLLELLIHDPHFAWLRGLSKTIVALDELVADKEIDPATLIERARAMMEQPPEPRLVDLIQQDPTVAIAFSEVNACLGRLDPHDDAVDVDDPDVGAGR
jgi:hypothetical protein